MGTVGRLALNDLSYTQQPDKSKILYGLFNLSKTCLISALGKYFLTD